MTTGKTVPIDYQIGNTKASVQMFIDKLTEIQRSRIKTVNIDMSVPYISAIRTNLPNAKIIIDKFHLLSELNRGIEMIKRQTLLKMKEKELRIKKTERYNPHREQIINKEFRLFNQRETHALRWAVVKRPTHLNDYQSQVLKKLEKWNMPLYKAYLLKEQFYALLIPQPKEIAQVNIRLWMEEARKTKLTGLISFCKTLDAHFSYVLNYFEIGTTSGGIEGANNKIKTIKRMGYGYRNLDYFFRKIRSRFFHLPKLYTLFTYT